MINQIGFKEFILPKARWKFFIRVLTVAVIALIFFRFIAVPSRVLGRSMEPAYEDGALVFYLPWLPYLQPPEIGDVVVVKMAGRRITLLKRIVAMPGDTVEFREGWLYVNGDRKEEPYVLFRNKWELEPRTVRPGHVYVIGDNRGMPIDQHDFGQTEKNRITGYPLW